MSEKLQSAIKWGVIGSIASAILGLVFYIFNLDSMSALKYLSFAIMIGVIIGGAYEFKDKISGGKVNFSKLLGYSMLLVLVYALISSIWSIIYMEFVDINMVADILLQTELEMEAKGLDAEIIDQTLSVTKKMFTPLIFFFTSILSLLFFGLVMSLPTSLILKNE